MPKSSIDDIKEKFFSKVGNNDTLMSDLFKIFSSSKAYGDDDLGQRFLIEDKSFNELANLVNENLYLDLGEFDGFVTYRFTIPLLKKLGMDLAIEMQEYLVGEK